MLFGKGNVDTGGQGKADPVTPLGKLHLGLFNEDGNDLKELFCFRELFAQAPSNVLFAKGESQSIGTKSSVFHEDTADNNRYQHQKTKDEEDAIFHHGKSARSRPNRNFKEKCSFEHFILA